MPPKTAHGAPTTRRFLDSADQFDRRQVNDLAECAAKIHRHLWRPLPDTCAAERQIFALGEAAGHVVGAYRWASLPHRTETRDNVQVGLADVIITVYVTAHVCNVDIDLIRLERDKPRGVHQQVRQVLVAAGKVIETYDLLGGRGRLFATRLAAVAEASRLAATALGIDLDAAWQREAERILEP